MITPEEFMQMKQFNRILIEAIFAQEDSFNKKFIIGNWGWSREPFELERVHLSGCRVRISVLFIEDQSTTDIYLDLGDVYDWHIEECEKMGE